MGLGEDPTAPEAPASRGTGSGPGTPASPGTGATPDIPADPGTGAIPDSPADPGTGATPDSPADSGTGAGFRTPAGPGTGADPDSPASSGTGADPDTPGGAGAPAAPGFAIYPLSLRLEGRLAVVVGGGPVALRRVAGLRAAGADVQVVSPELTPALGDLAERGLITARRRGYQPGDLDGAWLAFACTDQPDVNAAVAADAEEQRIWCVRADDAVASAAWVPAVGRSGPVTLAVNAGRNPRRAAALRDRLVETVETAAEPPGTRPVPGGRVSIVGGGPGDPGLITVTGLRRLRDADVVVADRLAPLELLEEVPPGAYVIDAAKVPGGPAMRQDHINHALVEHARAGRAVVRLKGGDPFVFGRGREELEACLTAGVPVEVVPGVTSAISVPAAAGIPVTHRGLSQGFCVLAGHVRPGDPRSSVDWAALARSGMTLVLLMAVDHLAAIADALLVAGLGPETPGAAISDGWTRRQRVVTAPLRDLAAAVTRAGIANPAVIVIGEVAQLAPIAHGQPGMPTPADPTPGDPVPGGPAPAVGPAQDAAPPRQADEPHPAGPVTRADLAGYGATIRPTSVVAGTHETIATLSAQRLDAPAANPTTRAANVTPRATATNAHTAALPTNQATAANAASTPGAADAPTTHATATHATATPTTHATATPTTHATATPTTHATATPTTHATATPTTHATATPTPSAADATISHPTATPTTHATAASTPSAADATISHATATPTTHAIATPTTHATPTTPTTHATATPTTHAADATTPGAADATDPPPRRILVLGGARSGKSHAAEQMLAGCESVDYVATGASPGTGDDEWDDRVREHQARRPAHWRTVETLAVADVLAGPEAGPTAAPSGAAPPVLVDCLTTWLARVMDDCGAWDGGAEAGRAVAGCLDRLLAAWQQTRRHVVAVSNEIGSGVVPETASGRRFRDELGQLNARIAAVSDEVWLCTAGIARRLR
jgi:uroporphyrin-III C-methyltransferase / precorrin-2 dehydrogenase / sirohydrochlorin ferrochelatase